MHAQLVQRRANGGRRVAERRDVFQRAARGERADDVEQRPQEKRHYDFQRFHAIRHCPRIKATSDGPPIGPVAARRAVPRKDLAA